MDITNILLVGFTCIFFATAVIGIASIPDWIKIPEWYRKRIFIVLILEVIAVIIMIVKKDQFSSEGIPIITAGPLENNWVALDDKGVIINPTLTIKANDTTITEELGKKSFSEFKGLSGEMSSKNLSVKNVDSMTLGTIRETALKQIGLFNSIKGITEKRISANHLAFIRWETSGDGKWSASDKFEKSPFQLTVSEGYYVINYGEITNTASDSLAFDSRGKSFTKYFDVGNRVTHLFEDKNIYYLFRITHADLEKGHPNKFVEVINIRLEPTIEEK
jgi:hypothetical protein